MHWESLVPASLPVYDGCKAQITDPVLIESSTVFQMCAICSSMREASKGVLFCSGLEESCKIMLLIFLT